MRDVIPQNAEAQNKRGNPCGVCGTSHGAGPCSPKGGTSIPLTVPASDPNLDLIGHEFDGPDHTRWVVVGTTSWSSQYVHTRTVEGVTKESCANAKLLRESR